MSTPIDSNSSGWNVAGATITFNANPTAVHIGYLNPFTGEYEQLVSESAMYHRLFECASKRISEMQDEIDALKRRVG